jgi:hypothetical protein
MGLLHLNNDALSGSLPFFLIACLLSFTYAPPRTFVSHFVEFCLFAQLVELGFLWCSTQFLSWDRERRKGTVAQVVKAVGETIIITKQIHDAFLFAGLTNEAKYNAMVKTGTFLSAMCESPFDLVC